MKRLAYFGILGMVLLVMGCGGRPGDKNGNKEDPTTTETRDDEASRKEFKLRDGIFTERPDAIALEADNPFNVDNHIFREGRQFIYAYTHYTPKGQAVYNHPSAGTGIPIDKAWIYLPIEELGPETTIKARLSVVEGYGRLGRFLTKKNFTFVTYEHIRFDGKATNNVQVGIVENAKNIWLIPPRGQLFNMLQSCPYPFIQAPFEVGHTWTWNDKVSKRFGDPRWGDWQGEEEMSYTYEITAKKQFDTKFGLLECYEVQARGRGLIGSSSLTSLFHPDYGFIRMTFKHINNSQTVLELEEIIDAPEDTEGGEEEPLQ